MDVGFKVFICGKLQNNGKLESYPLHGKVIKAFRKTCKPVVICWGKSLVLGTLAQFKYVKGKTLGTPKILATSNSIADQKFDFQNCSWGYFRENNLLSNDTLVHMVGL